MIICSPVKSCTKIVLPVSGCFREQMTSRVCNIASPTLSSSCFLCFKQGNSRNRYSRISLPGTSSCFSHCGFQTCQRFHYRSAESSKNRCCPSLTFKSLVSSRGSQVSSIKFSSWNQNSSVRILVPRRRLLSNFKCNVGPFSWSRVYGPAGLMSGLFVCYSSSDSVHAEAAERGGDRECRDSSSDRYSHGKKVLTDYSVIGIPGDGRCLFRSVAHGACLRSGKPAPSESHQKQLADELRAMVADEFIRRRQETEWFIEGDFDTYVSQIRKRHVWGGEPELLMLSHVLRMPITVYMRDDKYGGLISIAEYGQEYGRDNPIRVLYHGYGHYDALLMPGKKDLKPRL